MSVTALDQDCNTKTSNVSKSDQKQKRRARRIAGVNRVKTVRFRSEHKHRNAQSPQTHKWRAQNDVPLDFLKISPDKLCDTFRPSISSLIEFNVLREQVKLQNKIDYYITPYNSEINVQESMQFGDKAKPVNNTDELAKKDWKMISDFILKTSKREFRQVLGQTNKELYEKITNLAISMLNDKKERLRPKRHISRRTNLSCPKSLKRQQTMIYKNEFKSNIKQSYENYVHASSKAIGELHSKEESTCSDLDTYRNENIPESSENLTRDAKENMSSLKIPKLDFPSNNTCGIDDPKSPSIISPLMKMLRQMDKPKHDVNKSKIVNSKDQNANKFEIKLQDIKVKGKKSKRIKNTENIVQNYYNRRYLLPQKSNDDFEITRLTQRNHSEKLQASSNKNQRNLSSSKVNEYSSYFKGPNVNKENGSLLPPIKQNSGNYLTARTTVVAKIRGKSCRSNNSSCLVSTKPSSNKLDMVGIESTKQPNQSNICKFCTKIGPNGSSKCLHKPLNHLRHINSNIEAPVLTVNKLDNSSGVENEYNDSLSHVSSVSIASSGHNSIYSKRNCRGMYEILESIKANTVDTRDSSNLKIDTPILDQNQSTNEFMKSFKEHHQRTSSCTKSSSKPNSQGVKQDSFHLYQPQKLKSRPIKRRGKEVEFKVSSKTQSKLMKFL